MHPELRTPPEEPVPCPELYWEERFVKAFDRASYLVRQAGSALYLAWMYREWLIASRYPVSESNPYWACGLVGPLMHLVHVHELQAHEEMHGEAVERESWYLAEMYRRMDAKPTDHSVRLAIHAVMYLRGLYRYRQVIQWSTISHPWNIWSRDAELNARLCFDVLYEMETFSVAQAIVKRVVAMEEAVMKEIEAKKESAE